MPRSDIRIALRTLDFDERFPTDSWKINNLTQTVDQEVRIHPAVPRTFISGSETYVTVSIPGSFANSVSPCEVTPNRTADMGDNLVLICSEVDIAPFMPIARSKLPAAVVRWFQNRAVGRNPRHHLLLIGSLRARRIRDVSVCRADSARHGGLYSCPPSLSPSSLGRLSQFLDGKKTRGEGTPVLRAFDEWQLSF
jgi:hypothetical protein